MKPAKKLPINVPIGMAKLTIETTTGNLVIGISYADIGTATGKHNPSPIPSIILNINTAKYVLYTNGKTNNKLNNTTIIVPVVII